MPHSLMGALFMMVLIAGLYFMPTLFSKTGIDIECGNQH
jgi:hypothetical protein